jgi:hypothetical protein
VAGQLAEQFRHVSLAARRFHVVLSHQPGAQACERTRGLQELPYLRPNRAQREVLPGTNIEDYRLSAQLAGYSLRGQYDELFRCLHDTSNATTKPIYIKRTLTIDNLFPNPQSC